MGKAIADLKSVAFKMDSDILDTASAVFKENGYSLTRGLRVFLKSVALTKSVDLPDEEDLEKEFIFRQLQSEIKEGIEAYERGECISLEKVRSELGL